MTALIFTGRQDRTPYEAPIPIDGTPVAVPCTRRVCLGWSGPNLITLDLDGASDAWVADLRKALGEAAAGGGAP